MAAEISQVEIARQLGLSQRAVSFALNGKAGVSQKTRQRVLRKAAEMGYRPNALARSIRQGRFGQVALLNSTIRAVSYQPPQLLSAVHDALAAHDLYLLYTQLPDADLASETFVPGILRELRVDGLLINYRHNIPARMVELIDSHRLPAIWLGATRAHDCVYPDDEGAAAEQVNRLIALGHRKIAFVDLSGSMELAPDARPATVQRRRGYEQAMRAAGLQPRLICHGGRPEQWAEHMIAIMREDDRPTALISCEARQVGFLWSALVEDLGLRLGRDVSLVSFGPQPILVGRHWIDTLLTPHAQVGREAVEMLMEKLRAPAVRLTPRVCPHRLHTGDTVGPAPSP